MARLPLAFCSNIDFVNWLYIIACVLIFPLAVVLPPGSGWENNFIENSQVVILAFCAGACLLFRSRFPDLKIRRWWFVLFFLFLLLIFRELSWGRVFFQTAMTDKGPMFLAMKHIKYHVLIETGIGIYIVSLIIGFCVTTPWRKILSIPVPLAGISIIALCAAIVTLSEEHVFFDSANMSMTLEELAETIAYLSLFRLIHYYCQNLTRGLSMQFADDAVYEGEELESMEPNHSA